MEKWVSKWLEMLLRGKDLNERGFNPPLIPFPCCCLRRRFKPLAFSAPPPHPWVNNPSGSSPFCTYISLYLVYGNVLCMIETLIHIYSCNIVKVTKRTSRQVRREATASLNFCREGVLLTI